MRCSGCGKDIPFSGQVCPYCQRDKSKDQAVTVAAFILGVIGGAIGYFLLGFWGALGGFFIGCIVAGVASSSSETKPPQVQIASPPVSPQANTIASKLTQLKVLHEQGLLTAEEFAAKKAEIMSKF